MSDLAVKVEGLGKRFSIGHQRPSDLRNAFSKKISSLFDKGPNTREVFWALRDVSFEIKKGEAVGIIGRNGAGKSTLLKILSRITNPTVGRFEINGRVSSLLEVGTGFHSELTGRENIFLNGTILGMKRAEIRAKFDQIVEFSGVEKFLDTPVKHYSSGMKVRLAFSVAAHLEPEILIVDEVLAVGDAEFQKRCLGKMDEVSRSEGRTILFVSHNMSAIEQLCTKGILLDRGQVKLLGEIDEIVSCYQESLLTPFNKEQDETELVNGVFLKEFSFQESKNSAKTVDYCIKIKSSTSNKITDLSILIYNYLNQRIGIIDLRSHDLSIRSNQSREITISGTISNLPLIEGVYNLGIYISSLHCNGDFLNLKRLELKALDRKQIPYAIKYRGYIEFQNQFVIN